jgi:hypothetical protein
MQGTINVVNANELTLTGPSIDGQYASAALLKIAANTWQLIGSLE